MVAEQDILDELETTIKGLNDMKDSFSDELAISLAKISRDFNTMEARMSIIVQGVQAKFTDSQEAPRNKLSELERNLQITYVEGNNKFFELDENLKQNSGSGVGGKDNKRSCFLPDKILISSAFEKEISVWRQ